MEQLGVGDGLVGVVLRTCLVYEVHVALLFLEFFLLEYPLALTLVEEGEHVGWLVVVGESSNEIHSAVRLCLGFFNAFLEI